jgi:hypothetical protein
MKERKRVIFAVPDQFEELLSLAQKHDIDTTALVAAREAAIWAAPMPKYRQDAKIKGGVPDGPSHEQRGIDLISSQRGKKVGKMEGGDPGTQGSAQKNY